MIFNSKLDQSSQREGQNSLISRLINLFKLGFSFINETEEVINCPQNSIYRSYIRELNNRREKFNILESVESSNDSETEFDVPFHEQKPPVQDRIPLKFIQNHYDNKLEKRSHRESKSSLRQEIGVILLQSKECSLHSEASLMDSHYKKDDFDMSIHLRKKCAPPAQKNQSNQTKVIGYQPLIADKFQEQLQKSDKDKQKQQIKPKSTGVGIFKHHIKNQIIRPLSQMNRQL